MIFTKRGALAFDAGRSDRGGGAGRSVDADDRVRPPTRSRRSTARPRMLCEIRLAFGERVTRAWNGQARAMVAGWR